MSMKQEDRIPCSNKYGDVIMSLLENEVTLKGIRGAKKVIAFFDSGASYSCVRRDVTEEISIPMPLPEPISFETADEGSYITAKRAI